ncbi:MAG: carbohydrate-binding family 9-like protein [Victivallaceae bacterium]
MNIVFKRKLFREIMLITVLLTNSVFSEETPYCCLKTKENINIDGKLEESIWKQAPAIHFKELVTGAEPKLDSEAKIIWDDNYIYIGMEFKDPNVWATIDYKEFKRFDGKRYPARPKFEMMRTDTFAKVFLDPDADGKYYLEFHINSLNRVDTTYLNVGCSMLNKPFKEFENHTDWDCHKLMHNVFIDGTLNDFGDKDNGWSFELAIPWHEMQLFIKGNCPPKAGDIWKAHLARVFKKGFKQPNQYWTWPTIGLKQCHIPEKWETIKFLEYPEEKFPKKICRIGWISGHSKGIKKESAKVIEAASKFGFNILVCGGNDYQYINELCNLGKKANIDIFWSFNLGTIKTPQRLKQVVNEVEKSKINRIQKTAHPLEIGYQYGGEPINTETDVIITPLPCFHHPEVMTLCQKKLDEILNNCPDLKGIAFDYIGYRNYQACRCNISQKMFNDYYEKYLKGKLRKEKALEQFSLDTLVDFNNRLVDYIKSKKKNLKVATHVYPVFVAEPLYGNRLNVDYCCQTVAWFFQPYWSLKKVEDYTRTVIESEQRYFISQGIPFVGIFDAPNEMVKSAKRFKEELAAIKKAGTKSLSIYPFDVLVRHPELGNIVIEELGK